MRMSSAPKPACLGFSTSVASRIAPAQVPKVGFTRTNCFSFSKPSSPNNFRNVPDSPPGITRPSMASSWSGFFTSTTSAPSSSRRRRWASKSPCRARTPIFISWTSVDSSLLPILPDISGSPALVVAKLEGKGAGKTRLKIQQADPVGGDGDANHGRDHFPQLRDPGLALVRSEVALRGSGVFRYDSLDRFEARVPANQQHLVRKG